MIRPHDSTLFAPFEGLAASLLASLPSHSDGSHDRAHLMRVWALVKRLQKAEGGDLEILLAATLLHDAINVEKSSPDRSKASTRSAEFAAQVLDGLGWSSERVSLTMHAIIAHSHSAGVQPTTLEARILQDADRLDAIGAIGIARCFYTAGRLGSKLYDPSDPAASFREPDDQRFALDHFTTKLFTLGVDLLTPTARMIARERQATMREFVDQLARDIGG